MPNHHLVMGHVNGVLDRKHLPPYQNQIALAAPLPFLAILAASVNGWKEQLKLVVLNQQSR